MGLLAHVFSREEQLLTVICFIESYMVVYLLSYVRLFAAPWTVAHQAPPSMGFSRQEYWSELPFPSPGDFPDPGIKLTSSASPELQANSLSTELSRKTIVRDKRGNIYNVV